MWNIIVTNKHSSKEVGRSATVESFVVDGFLVSQRITWNDTGRATLRIFDLWKFSGAPPCENLVERWMATVTGIIMVSTMQWWFYFSSECCQRNQEFLDIMTTPWNRIQGFEHENQTLNWVVPWFLAKGDILLWVHELPWILVAVPISYFGDGDRTVIVDTIVLPVTAVKFSCVHTIVAVEDRANTSVWAVEVQQCTTGVQLFWGHPSFCLQPVFVECGLKSPDLGLQSWKKYIM